MQEYLQRGPHISPCCIQTSLVDGDQIRLARRISRVVGSRRGKLSGNPRITRSVLVLVLPIEAIRCFLSRLISLSPVDKSSVDTWLPFYFYISTRWVTIRQQTGPCEFTWQVDQETQTKRALAYKQGTLLRLRACISFGMPWQVPRGLDVESFLRAADASFPYCSTALQLGDFFSLSFLGEVVPLALGKDNGGFSGALQRTCRTQSHSWPARTGLEAVSVLVCRYY